MIALDALTLAEVLVGGVRAGRGAAMRDDLHARLATRRTTSADAPPSRRCCPSPSSMGRRRPPPAEHTYRQAAGFSPYVSIEWSGTYRVNGEAPLPIAGRVTTDGEPVDLQVREARSELVAG